jgi:hypothetical protein
MVGGGVVGSGVDEFKNIIRFGFHFSHPTNHQLLHYQLINYFLVFLVGAG